MKIWTFNEAKVKIQKDMDLEEETFIDDPDEYYGYFNEAIDEAEAEILKLYQYYFKTEIDITWVDGTARYSLPADIYGNKILYIQYERDQTRRYQIVRIRNNEIADVADDAGYNNYYYFDIQNTDAATGVEIIFYPTPRESGSYVKMYYLRNANRVDATDSKIDIPEFINFIFAYVKVRIAEKETSPLLNNYLQGLERQRMLMKQTLDNMIPDELEVIDPDLSFYQEFYYDEYIR